MFDTRFRALFSKGLRSTVPATHQKNDDSFTKRRFRPFQNIVLSSQNTARATKKSSKTTSISAQACQSFSSVHEVLACHADEKVSDVLRLVTQNDVSDRLLRKTHVA